MEKCPLCAGRTEEFSRALERLYHKCQNCGSVFLDSAYFLTPEEEKERYLNHNNDVKDEGYRQFVSPITNFIFENFSSEDEGLDFGAGTGPVIAKVLEEKGYKMKLYDPFFHPNESFLNEEYDFIACCEVMEHFCDPKKEFSKLKNLLKPGGMLFCMTDMYTADIDFDSWYYKNDPTHVFLYSEKAVEWIREFFNFKKMEIRGRLIVFWN